MRNAKAMSILQSAQSGAKRRLDYQCTTDTRKPSGAPPARAVVKIWLTDLQALADKALAAGARRPSLMRIEWDISGDCQSPVWRECHARPESTDETGSVVVTRKSTNPLTVTMEVRCRRCDRCRRQRAALWRQRARAECASAARTWMGTLTLSPGEHARVLASARARARKSLVDLDAQPFGEQFQARHAEIQPHITRMIKRVRKNSGVPLRYMVVAEAHASGLPHYHVLVHEVDPLQPITYRMLQHEWKLGFSRWKLVDDPVKGAYVTKYLSKSLAARVRASQGYGSDDERREEDTDRSRRRMEGLNVIKRSVAIGAAIAAHVKT